MLLFVYNPDSTAVLIAHDLRQGEFVLQVSFYPPQQKLEEFTQEVCSRIIWKAVGREVGDLKVSTVKPWTVRAQYAERFLSYGNRVILAGDAAHQLPPMGGFGMSTGIHDAHNLAWKLASVLQGIAPLSFLSTYEIERQHIANFNMTLAMESVKKWMGVYAALGLNPIFEKLVHLAVNSTPGSILPSGVQKAILDGMLKLLSLQISDRILNDKNPIGRSRLAKLTQILEGGDSLQLLFPAEDLGFRYVEGALAVDGDNKLDESELPTGRRRDYVPSGKIGSRLPHMNARILFDPSNLNIFSTLDLVSVERVEFVLIISPLQDSYRLARAAFTAAEQVKLPLKVCVVWPENTTVGVDTSVVGLTPWTNVVDVVEVKRSPTSPAWWNLCQLTDEGAILLRPDEHIAWVSKSGKFEDPVLEMKQVFSKILGLDR